MSIRIHVGPGWREWWLARGEQGMATAEYSIGTLGAAVIGAVLYRYGLLDHNVFTDLISSVWHGIVSGSAFRFVPHWPHWPHWPW